MNDLDLTCKDEQRRERVREKYDLNGLDYIEVDLFDDHGVPLTYPVLRVYFLGKAPERPIEPRNVRIEGGRRILGRDLQVKDLKVQRLDSPEADDYLIIAVDKSGDFSTYTLRLVEQDRNGRPRPFPGFDPRYASLQFSFKADCPTDLDCKVEPLCPPEKRDEPEINYLAKDYASFRQLILDRLALIMPDWKERHVPDLGIVLVELLAYTGDHLSYYQDAVATEAYLDTARQRISVRRHVRLVDYTLHEGCNARAWVAVWVSQDIVKPPLMSDQFYFITDPGVATAGNIHKEEDLPKTLPKPYLVFEPLVEDRQSEIKFFAAQNEIKIYSWGDQQCCLPKGATSATLVDPGNAPAPDLKEQDRREDPGQQAVAAASQPAHGEERLKPVQDNRHKLFLRECDVLIFEEVKGPKTGNPADADPRHRHAVRLTKATKANDPLTGQLLLEIEWAKEDALPFPVCVSSIKQEDCSFIADVTVVRGNVLLVDHGERVVDDLGRVPSEIVLPDCEEECSAHEVQKRAGWYRPKLPVSGVTFSESLPPCRAAFETWTAELKVTPASVLLKQDPRNALPQVTLFGFPAAPDGEAAFTPNDLTDPRSLAGVIANEERPQSRYLKGRLSPDTWNLLDRYNRGEPIPSERRRAMMAEIESLRQKWEPRRDLLSSLAGDRHFVVEMDDNRFGHLRFGDGDLGQVPEPGTTFQASYRVGNGPAGNVGADAISHIVFRKTALSGIEIRPRNPLPASGGSLPEPIAEAKLLAPGAFRKVLQRAITADDYAQIVMRDFKHTVQRAAAVLLWTGSWYEAQVAIDPAGNVEPNDDLLLAIERRLRRYRRVGHDLRVVRARYVPLEIELTVCVLPHYLRGHVEAVLLDVFSNRALPDGRLGFFHPDKLTFGEGIYLSKLIAAAQAVAGIQSVQVTKLQRFAEAPAGEIESGILPLGPLEVARLDNDPSFPEQGTLKLTMGGGR